MFFRKFGEAVKVVKIVNREKFHSACESKFNLSAKHMFIKTISNGLSILLAKLRICTEKIYIKYNYIWSQYFIFFYVIPILIFGSGRAEPYISLECMYVCMQQIVRPVIGRAPSKLTNKRQAQPVPSLIVIKWLPMLLKNNFLDRRPSREYPVQFNSTQLKLV
jgi:hypothetical protein